MRPTLGIDVGGTKLLAVALDEAGGILAADRAPTPKGSSIKGGGGTLLNAVGELARRVLEQAGVVVEAVGIGVPGLVDSSGVLRFAPNLASGEGVDFRAGLSSLLGIASVAVDNDATCALVGELSYGAAKGCAEVVMVTFGTGIGGGIASGGRVLRGAHGFAGEVGHMVVDPGGPRCTCGLRGCWERYASGSGLARLAREAALGGRIEEVVRLAGGDPEAVRAEHVTEAAAVGDPGALAVLEELGWWMGLGLSNLVAVMDPELVVLGGGLLGAGDWVMGPARRAFSEILRGHEGRPMPRITEAGLLESAGAVGAAVMAREL